MNFTTKDSGAREEFESGMVRDTQEGKARFDLLHPIGVPYPEQMLTRFANLMTRGAEKYGDRNWERAKGPEELARYKSSALRHLQQWVAGEDDEDHAAAVMFNILAGETVKYRMRRKGIDNPCCSSENPHTDNAIRLGMHWSKWDGVTYPPEKPSKNLEAEAQPEAPSDPICDVECNVYAGHPPCDLPAGHTALHHHAEVKGQETIREYDW